MITIDGDNISEVTIDGEDVKAVTIDGDLVWPENVIIYSYRDTDLKIWDDPILDIFDDPRNDEINDYNLITVEEGDLENIGIAEMAECVVIGQPGNDYEEHSESNYISNTLHNNVPIIAMGSHTARNALNMSSSSEYLTDTGVNIGDADHDLHQYMSWGESPPSYYYSDDDEFGAHTLGNLENDVSIILSFGSYSANEDEYILTEKSNSDNNSMFVGFIKNGDVNYSDNEIDFLEASILYLVE